MTTSRIWLFRMWWQNNHIPVTGIVLSRTICSKSFFIKCKEALTVPSPDPELHKLIVEHSYRIGALVFPSNLAVKVFGYSNSVFRQNRDHFFHRGNDKLYEKLTNDLKEIIVGNCSNMPMCHLHRYFKLKLIF